MAGEDQELMLMTVEKKQHPERVRRTWRPAWTPRGPQRRRTDLAEKHSRSGSVDRSKALEEERDLYGESRPFNWSQIRESTRQGDPERDLPDQICVTVNALWP